MLFRSERIEKTVNARFVVEFGYLAMNDVMRVVKEMQPVVADQCFDNACRMTLSIRRSREEALRDRLSKVEGLHMEFEGYE